MKKSLIVLVPAALMLLTAVMCGNDYSRPAQPLVAAETRSVDGPRKIVFAGEEIDLSRYDKRERFDREINGFTYMHSSTMLLIKRANRFFPIIEPLLKEHGLPDDFKYLCVIESSLDIRAYSSAGAAGLWQFMKSTAPNYGLEISAEVDERYSVEKATIAACEYLKEAYGKYGSWAAAALSYNGGQGRITREMEKQAPDDYLDLLLVEETSRYYYRMLAAKTVFENPQAYGFMLRRHQLYKPIRCKRMLVTQTIDDLTALAKNNGLTYAQLKDFNTWLRANTLTVKDGKTYTIALPDPNDLYYKKNERVKVHNPAWVVD